MFPTWAIPEGIKYSHAAEHQERRQQPWFTHEQSNNKKTTSICIIAAAVLRNLELHLGLLKCLPFVTDNSWITAGSGVKQYSCHGFWFPLCYFLLSLVMLGSCSFQFPATPDTKQIIIFPSVYFAARANIHRNTAYKAESRHTIVPSGPMWIKH